MITIKILSLGSSERYAVRRTVMAVQNEILNADPRLQMTISEVDAADQIIRYASVLVLPTLVINDKVVCSGRFPSRDEIAGWIHKAAEEH